jgi:peptidoglycan/xylan/chitin deacetylase (PgdA/CDA1 family)
VYDFKDDKVITNLIQIKPIEKPTVALTFDDGPGKYINKILNILNKNHIQATFFWQSRLLYNERPWKRTIDEGHVIGTHTINHPNLARLSYKEQFRQISKSKQHLEQIIGQDIHYFRPPFGVYNETTINITNELKLTPILWSISSFDWKLKDYPNKIIENVVHNLHDGGIILLHELEQTVMILPKLIQEIKGKGYEFTVI